MVDSLVILCDSAPVGKNSAIEAIRMGSGLVALGETVQTTVVFDGDAVLMLAKNADPAAVGQDTYDTVMEMADLSDLEIRVVQEALDEAGLGQEDLRSYGKLQTISRAELAAILSSAGAAFRL
ncbi:MAG TPA: DsrE family protein [Candidatus Lokiarchaeia archaeon]|nr:DsrE family protein [Candidatus Lokiarchaeia archaeon]